MNQKSEMITIKDLFLITIHYKKMIAKFIAVTLLLAVLFLNFSPKKYQAQIVFGAKNEQNSSGLNYMISSFAGGGEASSDPDLIHFSHLLNSGAMAHQLSQDEKVMQTIFASEYDKKNKQWKAPITIRTMLKKIVYFICGYPTYTAPDVYRLNLYLEKEISVSEIEKSGLFAVSYKHENPEFAKYLLNETYRLAEDRIRQEELSKSVEVSDFINQKLDEVKGVSTIEALTSLLLQEERKKILLSNKNQPIAVNKINTVPVSKMPVSPNPKFVLVLAITIGFLSGFITAVLKAKHLR
jgi:uncharacterized protein involved in exopolysaccharide biosynthesis